MRAGWYAAIIRMRIKQQLHVRVGTNLTLRIQGGILLSPQLLSTPDEAAGRVALHLILPANVMQPINKTESYFSPFNFSSICQNRFTVMRSCPLCMYLCLHAFGPHLCPCILMRAIMHVWMYGCMQRATGQWGIEFGWWGMGMVMGVQSGGGLVGDGVNGNRVKDGGGSWCITGVLPVRAIPVFCTCSERFSNKRPVRLEIRWHWHDK